MSQNHYGESYLKIVENGMYSALSQRLNTAYSSSSKTYFCFSTNKKFQTKFIKVKKLFFFHHPYMSIWSCCRFCLHDNTSLLFWGWWWWWSACNLLNLPLKIFYLIISFIHRALHARQSLLQCLVLIHDVLSFSVQLLHVCSHHVLHLLPLIFHVGSQLFFQASSIFLLFHF